MRSPDFHSRGIPVTRKRTALLLAACLAFAALASPSMAMDKHDKIWLRDALVGGGAGLAIGLVTERSGSWLLAGLVVGGIFGYFDAEKGLVEYQRGDLHVAALAGVTVEPLRIEGREAVPVMKATLLRADW